MATLTMDTHRIVKRLKDAGFSDSQAETVTDIIAETRATDLADVASHADIVGLKSDLAAIKADLAAVRGEMATKADLAAVRSEMATRADLAAVRSEMATRADLAALEVRMIKWLVPLMLGQTGLIVALVKLLS